MPTEHVESWAQGHGSDTGQLYRFKKHQLSKWLLVEAKGLQHGYLKQEAIFREHRGSTLCSSEEVPAGGVAQGEDIYSEAQGSSHNTWLGLRQQVQG